MINQLKDIFRGYDIKMKGESIFLENSNKIIFLSQDKDVVNNIYYYTTYKKHKLYFVSKNENLIIIKSKSKFLFSIKLSYIKKLIRKRKIKKIRECLIN